MVKIYSVVDKDKELFFQIDKSEKDFLPRLINFIYGKGAEELLKDYKEQEYFSFKKDKISMAIISMGDKIGILIQGLDDNGILEFF
jgi:hypothetical protein